MFKVSLYSTGDHRQSETPTLTIMHTTWLRRHNLIADALRTATGITDDETLFQEAKRIVVAELQHITYNEFLPAVLNNRHLNFFNLLSRRSGHDNIYNPSVDPRTFNSFGAAVLRMGHSLVRNVVGHDNGRGQVQTFPLKDHFENPDLIFSPSYGYEYMARWMSKSPKSRSDRTLVDGIRNRLFEGPPGPYPSETLSFDLGALNIQRGREHGLPPYNAFRRFCGRYPAYHFSTTSRGGLVDHSPQNAARLARVYRYAMLYSSCYQCCLRLTFIVFTISKTDCRQTTIILFFFLLQKSSWYRLVCWRYFGDPRPGRNPGPHLLLSVGLPVLSVQTWR